jgi:glycosyltransferase involved in cell wall biosynthesis
MDAFSRVRQVNAKRGAVAFLQRNLLATLVTAEPWLKRPFLFDVDDAIFLGNRGSTANSIARRAALILCGNQFLAEHFRAFGNVRIVPTAVDVDVFTVRASPPARPVVGWSGSSSGLTYLYAIEPALIALTQRYQDLQLLVVSNEAPKFQRLPANKVVYLPWQPSIEASVLHRVTVGLMPLEDTPWSRGKCSFKMLTYMASGVPVVVSPVGMNAEVLALGPCGLGATTHDEWVHAIAQIIEQPSTAQAMGQHGRAIVEQHFARAPVGRQLDAALREVAAGG